MIKLYFTLSLTVTLFIDLRNIEILYPEGKYVNLRNYRTHIEGNSEGKGGRIKTLYSHVKTLPATTAIPP